MYKTVVALSALVLAFGYFFMKSSYAGEKLPVPDETQRPPNAEVATFAAGCFWCVEEVFHQQKGVVAAISGYMGGTSENAKYRKVAQGLTDHAEVVQVVFDPEEVSYGELVELFWKLHDPTQVNRQGPDVGRQYRSSIFYHDDAQKETAEKSKAKLDASKKLKRPVATEIVKAGGFYPAEDYHQNYARLHPGDFYLRANLYPKLSKLGLKIPGK